MTKGGGSGLASSKKSSSKMPSKPVGGTKTSCKTPVLEGQVVSLTWKSGIKVAWGKKKVSTPHWKKALGVQDGDGSKRAAVYLVDGKGGSQDVEVEVEITKAENVSGSGKVLGVLGDLEIEGTCPAKRGKHKTKARIKKLPKKVGRHKGDVTWGFECASLGKTVTLANATRAEVFVVLDKPRSFYKKGVWVEALRFLCDTVGVTGSDTGPKAIAKITKYCHTSHGLRYHTLGGAPAYGVGGSGGTFKLRLYLKASLAVVNCYDQAAAVQSLSGALGLPTKWCYQGSGGKIFGFIAKTDLIGVGQCNNPFFQSNGSAKVVAATDPKRTAFGNHAFCELVAKIADACAGPHKGTEDATQYLTASVDYAETTRRGHTAGLAGDILHPAGVTKVE